MIERLPLWPQRKPKPVKDYLYLWKLSERTGIRYRRLFGKVANDRFNREIPYEDHLDRLVVLEDQALTLHMKINNLYIEARFNVDNPED